MSSLSGGPAEKAGMIHEALWDICAMLAICRDASALLMIDPAS
jgi:hypothetical protein